MYGALGYRRSRTKIVEKIKLPRLRGFSKLSLGDLKKVKGYYDIYHSEDEERLAAAQRSAAAEDGYERRKRVHSELVTKLNNEIKILESEIARLFAEAINKFEQGLIASIFNKRETISISYEFGSRVIVKTAESLALKARFDEKNKHYATARKTRTELQSNFPKYDFDYVSNFSHFCKDTKTFTIHGTRVEISVHDINITELEALIQSHNRKIEKLGELKARAASNVLETRRLAQSERKKLNKQLALLNCCPYCAKGLSSDAHLDHIYPVSKGGLSRPANLIFVCSACNVKKRDSTLRSFIEETGLDTIAIHERLTSLGKDF